MPDYKPRGKAGEQRHHVYVFVRERKEGESSTTTTTYYVESCDKKQQAVDVRDYMNERVPPTDEAVYHNGDYVPMKPYDKSRMKEHGNNDPIEKEMISL